MDIQALFDGLAEASRNTRKEYHLTLGGLINILRDTDNDIPVAFSDGTYPAGLDSYRGYYADLAFGRQDEPKTAGELLKQSSFAVNDTFEGWKGGEFVMEEDTPLWRAECGDLGDAIIDCVPQGAGLLLVTKTI